MGQNLHEFIGMLALVTTSTTLVMWFRYMIFKWCKEEKTDVRLKG